jgi:diacylglycerol kinase
MPSPKHNIRPRTWYQKFRDAFRGVRSGTRGQSSFQVHLAVAAATIATATFLHCDLPQWCILLLCIGGVLTAEMFNSALEHFAKVIDKEHNPELGEALDTASAAVLFASLGAAVVGGIIFVSRIVILINTRQ